MKLHIIKKVVLIVALVAVVSVAVMLLWNWLLPAILGVKTISFLQALGLLLLARLLFGGWGGGFASRLRSHGHQNPLREKWAKMSSEERDEFLRHRHAGHGRHMRREMKEEHGKED